MFLLAVAIAPAPNATAACYENDVIYCGFDTNQTFYNKVVANNDGHGHTDLQTLYGYFGLKTTTDYTAFRDKARAGVVYRDGRVVVDNQTVVSGAKSLGRQNIGGSSPIVIGGKHTITASQMTDGLHLETALMSGCFLIKQVLSVHCHECLW